jgi:hypothetical protein
MNIDQKIRLFSMILILALLAPSTALAAQGAAGAAPLKVKFSHGGLRLDISNNTSYWGLILNLTVAFCDGDSLTGRQIGAYRHYLSETFTYTAEKPMRSVVIDAVNPGPGESGKIVVVSLKRNCTPSSSPSPLFCNNVDLAPVIHRSTAEPVSFTGPAHLYNAGLRIPGVDGLALTRQIHRTSGYSWQHTVKYEHKSHTWSGYIPTLYIPVGRYQNVELVVQDGYGKQAKCRIGDLTVIP